MDVLSPQGSLLTRLDSLVARLGQARKAVADGAQNARLKKGIGDDLARRLGERIDALNKQRSKIANGSPAATNWKGTKSEGAESLLDESLLYLQAARARGPNADLDLCEIADAMFGEFAKAAGLEWNSFSVFAATDTFDAKTQVIRVRYPLSDIWDLPVGMHEFGHFLSSRLRQQRPDGSAFLPFQEHKDLFVPPKNDAGEELRRGVNWRAQVEEIFADVCAAYAGGPAFAYSCLLVRFDPAAANERSDAEHPTYAERAYAILQTLARRNNEDPGRNGLATIIERLDQCWQGACVAAESPVQIGADYQKWLGGQVSALYGMLKSGAGGLRFSRWESAAQKLQWLEESQPPSSTGDFSIAELLNTAWMCRAKANNKPKRISENFIKLALTKRKPYDE